MYYQQHGNLKTKTTALQSMRDVREYHRMQRAMRQEAVANKRGFRELPGYIEMELDTMGNAA